jgi:O-antigen ligase
MFDWYNQIMNKRLEKLFAWGLIVIFAGIVIHTPLSVWLGTIMPDYALLIKAWKEVIMLLLIPVAIILVTRHKLWQEFSRDWLFQLLIAYAVLHTVLAGIWWQGTAQTAAGLAIDLRYVLFFALIYTLLRIAPKYKNLLIKVAVGGAIVVLGFGTAQVFLPADMLSHIGYSDQTVKPFQLVDENPEYIRVNSTLRGPNPLGAYATTALIILSAFVLGQKRRLQHTHTRVLVSVLAIGGIASLWLSYSRSAILAALVGLGVVSVWAGHKKITRTTLLIGGIFIVLAGIGLFASWNSPFIQNVIFHDNPTTGAAVTSNDDHLTSLKVGGDRLAAQPLGAGIGSTGSASLLGSDGVIIESQYLFIAHEAGWLGLLLYVCIFVVLMWRLLQRRRDWLALGVFASGIALGLIGLLLPVWVDDTVSVIWWGLAALAISGKVTHGRQSSK